jgi:hypothetical protein
VRSKLPELTPHTSLVKQMSRRQAEEREDWRGKYAEIITRRVYGVPSGIKINPHEPSQVTKQVFSQEVNMGLSTGHHIKQVLQGGKLNAVLSLQGELRIQLNTIATTGAASTTGNAEEASSIADAIGEPIAVTVPQKVVQGSVGGQDLLYVDEHGQAYSVSAITVTTPESPAFLGQQQLQQVVISEPRPLKDIADPVILTSVGFSHAFLLTAT